MKRIITGLLALVIVGAATPAQAAGPNWLGRYCGIKGVTTSCVVDTTGDQVVKARSITVRDASGAAHRLTTKKAVKAMSRAHSKPCPKRGDWYGCYGTDPIAGAAIVMPDGLGISLRVFR